MTHLERRLTAVAELIPIPPADRFRDEVLGRLGTAPRPRRKRFVLVAVALIAASVGALPGPRGAFARWLGFESVRIEPGPLPTTPPPPTTPDASTAVPTTVLAHPELGPAVAIEEAEREWGRPVHLPDALGDPASVHVVDQAGISQVVAVYAASPDLPGGALVSLFAAQIDAAYFVKFVGADTKIETFTFESDPVIWLEGDPHQIAVTVDGEVVVETLRLATNTLLRQHGDVVLRIEADIRRHEAVRIAGTWEPSAG